MLALRQLLLKTMLPKLTEQQNRFVLEYASNGNNASEAYRVAYDCSNTKAENVHSAASKLLKNQGSAMDRANAQKRSASCS